MLRKPLKRPTKASGKIGGKKTCHQEPLGAKKAKKASERALEDLVLGGDDGIVELLEKTTQEKEPTSQKSHVKKKPAWEDDDDTHGSVLLNSDRKFVDIKHGEEAKITKSEYSQRLKSQFEKVSSAPNWAKLESEREKNSSDEDSDVEELLQKTGTYLTSSAALPKGVLQIKQCTDINKQNPLTSRVKALEFHPSAQVALTGGMNNTLTLFQVDGKTNPKIQSVFVDQFPIMCAHFTRDGEQVVMGSKHKRFKYFDMIGGRVVSVPVNGVEEISMTRFEVSPDGKYLVFLGSYGNMHFLSTKTKELLFTLTMNGEVSSVSFTNDGKQMVSHGDEGQVYVWDLQARDCVHRFVDEGCTRGTCVAISPNNQYMACGSSTGVVNLYETEACLTKKEPVPLKAIMNLTSPCALAKFNATSEMLAIASTDDEKAMKLIHVPSQSAFSNFPSRTDTNFRVPTAIDFSVNSGYLTVGTHKGQALLYRLKHYGNY